MSKSQPSSAPRLVPRLICGYDGTLGTEDDDIIGSTGDEVVFDCDVAKLEAAIEAVKAVRDRLWPYSRSPECAQEKHDFEIASDIDAALRGL